MEDARALGQELRKHKAGVGKRYPRELRRRVTDWASQRRASGASWSSLGAALGLKLETVRRWCLAASPKSAPTSLVPVLVREESIEDECFSVVSPLGYRVEALSLEQAAKLLRALG